MTDPAAAESERDRPPPRKAHVAHLSKRRLRLRIEGDRIGGEASQALADRLMSVQGVAHVVLRPNTGSLIIETLTEAAEVLEALKTHSALKIVATPKPPPLGQVMQLGLMKADMQIGQKTDGTLDLRTAIALLLIIAAIVQFGRGKVAGPTSTLLMSAFALLDKNAPRTGR